MELNEIEIHQLKPSEYNPRAITEKAMNGLKNSIKKFGLTQPIIANKDMTIIGGHQRLKAAIELGYQKVPCVFVDVNKVDEKALNITLNNKEINGYFTESLDEILGELKLEFAEFGDLNLGSLEMDFINEEFDHQTFTGKGKDPLEKIDGYMNAEIKSLTLMFSATEYKLAVSLFEKIVNEKNLKGNSEAALYLLENYESN